jgi:hypothetical protein
LKEMTARQHRRHYASSTGCGPSSTSRTSISSSQSRAAELAYLCALPGYDAIRCASARQLDDGDLVVASGDRQVLTACVSLGLDAADVNPRDLESTLHCRLGHLSEIGRTPDRAHVNRNYDERGPDNDFRRDRFAGQDGTECDSDHGHQRQRICGGGRRPVPDHEYEQVEQAD